MEKAKTLAPQAVLMEGYGITECAPVVSVNPRSAPRPGTIGKPLVGVQVTIRDPETLAPLPAGERGRLLVAGPNVFPGYLGGDSPAPFVELDGLRWYDTADLAAWDAEGYLIFHGRMKRFLKAGGEMISLPALEEPLSRRFPPGPEGPRVAVEGIERDPGRWIVLFTTEAITLAQANACLAEAGLRGVLRLDEVRRVERIPVLGTGKTDYKVLRAQIVQS
jgi:long-chain-fatty-acid--[acyl-carrier-protein] ligase